MTKPGNSGSEESKQAEAPEATTEQHESPTRAPGGPPNSTLPEGTDNSAAVEAEPAADAERAGTDAKPAATNGEPSAAKPAGTEPAAAGDSAASDEPEPAAEPSAATRATGAKPAPAAADEPGAAGTEPSAATGAAGAKPAQAAAEESAAAGAESAGVKEAKPAGAKPAAAKSADAKPADGEPVTPAAAKAKARRSKPVEDPEPLMAELEKAPPPPREDALRAQAKRRFEEPAPRTLRFSFYFFVVAGLIWLLSMIASLVYKQEIINTEIKRNQNPDITPDQISSAVNQILWIVTIAALAFTVFLALFGYKATEGTRRARTLVTIFATILVLFHLLLNGTQIGILSAMFALVGLALLWSPSARKYFPPRQMP